MIQNESLVTVNILSYNRKDDLRNTLKHVYNQSYKNIEVIVVDNASNDGTVEMVREEYPLVRLIELESNVGVSGWNEGFKTAKGEYVLVLDDDSYPENNTIELGIKEFSENMNLDVIAFRVYNLRIQKSETDNYLERPYYFNGCGAMIKKNVLKVVGYYNDKYFLYYNELDFSARCYNEGFTIRCISNATVIHTQSLNSRGSKKGDPFRSEYRFYYEFISYAIFLIQNFYVQYTILYLLKYIINRFVVCVGYGYFNKFISGLYYCLTNYNMLRRSGKILKPEVQKFYRNGNTAFIDRSYYPMFK